MGQEYDAVIASLFGGAIFMTAAWVYWKIRLLGGGGFGPIGELSAVLSILGMMGLGLLAGFLVWTRIVRRKRA